MMKTLQNGISANALRWIAMITMFVDHFGATVLYRYIFIYQNAQDNYHFMYYLYRAHRDLGRLAFPIYCFLLVEGFRHTKDLKKYIIRMAAFALLSELPYDLAISRDFVNFSRNNVGFTLLLGLLVISGVDYLRYRYGMGVKSTILQGLIFVSAAVAAYFGHVDYGAAGVLVIVIFYVMASNPMLAMALATIVLALLSSLTEFFALLDLIPLAFYNQTRGRQNKYLNYGFYPGHLLLLALLCYLLGLGI